LNGNLQFGKKSKDIRNIERKLFTPNFKIYFAISKGKRKKIAIRSIESFNFCWLSFESDYKID